MPQSDVVFYDAQCELCREWRRWMDHGQFDRPVVFADANDTAYAGKVGVSDLPRLQRQLCLLTRDGEALWGYDAVAGLVQRRTGSASVVWFLRLRPVRRVGTWVYQQVARRRRCGVNVAGVC